MFTDSTWAFYKIKRIISNYIFKIKNAFITYITSKSNLKAIVERCD